MTLKTQILNPLMQSQLEIQSHHHFEEGEGKMMAKYQMMLIHLPKEIMSEKRKNRSMNMKNLPNYRIHHNQVAAIWFLKQNQ